MYYSGGLELLFSNQRKHSLSLPVKDENGQKANMAFLVRYLCQHVMRDRRKDMFVVDDTVYVNPTVQRQLYSVSHILQASRHLSAYQ